MVVGDSVEMAVRDGGPGIPEDDIPTLFDRISAKHKHEQDTHSTGVGLAIVKHIMDLHKGKIQIQSKEGEGSLFTLCIPRTKND
jgi:two-component system phosphate regulon sensor histidine kinase PhoR